MALRRCASLLAAQRLQFAAASAAPAFASSSSAAFSSGATEISSQQQQQQQQAQQQQQEQQQQPGADEEANTADFGFREVPRAAKAGLVGEVFTSVASSYDVMNDLMSGGLHRLWKDRLVETLRPFPGMRHLDVAGGTGDVALRVLAAITAAESEAAARAAAPASAGPAPAPDAAPEPGHVTVCDINGSMLAVGRDKAARAGLLGRTTWVQGDAEKLPFPDGCVDAYTIAFGIRNVTDRGAALREALRVLRPGGRFLCLEFSQVTVPLLRQAYDAYSFAVIPRVGQLVAGDAESYQYLVESIRRFPDQEAFAGMMRAEGFQAVTYENLTAGVVALHSGFKF
ncbi:hypothetical protein Rsub_02471 [Raphidocelis subcapitata]|uniref:2-methoxy-6-polyprenyl-1,4-benzoquinol methylase, mitochondrial n=1 Tax=Raphidocelis subcapitata TaxID=307507 RepID=A0A2V0NZW4_9CHLO|nr:hypothetical protein Rsub_02471 [Raphidocelis subcapitata]|eukprot:GBF90365.1 hypothetical protein Rsub_02471 [Raphidocelis subcapitata]